MSNHFNIGCFKMSARFEPKITKKYSLIQCFQLLSLSPRFSFLPLLSLSLFSIFLLVVAKSFWFSFFFFSSLNSSCVFFLLVFPGAFLLYARITLAVFFLFFLVINPYCTISLILQFSILSYFVFSTICLYLNLTTLVLLFYSIFTRIQD